MGAAAAPIVTVIKGFADSKIVESQVRNGMPCQSYTFALLSLELPVFAFTAAVPLFFCGFLISNYEWKAFFPMMLCSILYQTALEGQAHISSLRKVFARLEMPRPRAWSPLLRGNWYPGA